MLDSFNLLRILCFKVSHPKSKHVEPDRVVDVFGRSYKGEEEHEVFQFFSYFKLLSAVAFAS